MSSTIPFDPFLMINFISRRIKYLEKMRDDYGGEIRDPIDVEDLTERANLLVKGIEAMEVAYPFIIQDYDLNFTEMFLLLRDNSIDEILNELKTNIELIEQTYKKLIIVKKILRVRLG